MKVLVLNSGSSSQKVCLYDLAAPLPVDPPTPLWEGKLEWRDDRASLEVRISSGEVSKENVPRGERPEATSCLLNELVAGKTRVLDAFSEIDVVGHRIVNGGGSLNRPTVITPAVKASIEKMAVFAPLHSRVELEGIALIEKLCGAVPQVAVFDIGFHTSLPDAAAIYPGPYRWAQQGIRKFGFHGINHQYCAGRVAQMLAKNLAELKLITCHLGNGCSLAAIRGGKSIDTTMGFTPLDGLMMGTRSGSVDPGILTYLMRTEKLDGEALDKILNSESGLLGISGLSADMREIVLAMQSGNQRAELAFEMFVHRLCAGIGAMLAALDGADAIVFTGGIGENSAEVRAASCNRFTYLGLSLDSQKNSSTLSDRDIAAAQSNVRILVIRAQEDWAIARDCWNLIAVEKRDSQSSAPPARTNRHSD
jgi:acetate kinase